MGIALNGIVVLAKLRLHMPVEVDFTLEEPAAARKNIVPANVAKVIAQVRDRVEPRVAVLARQRVDHVCREPMTGAQHAWGVDGVYEYTKQGGKQT